MPKASIWERDLTEENWERFAHRAGLPEGLKPVTTLENPASGQVWRNDPRGAHGCSPTTSHATPCGPG